MKISHVLRAENTNTLRQMLLVYGPRSLATCRSFWRRTESEVVEASRRDVRRYSGAPCSLAHSLPVMWTPVWVGSFLTWLSLDCAMSFSQSWQPGWAEH
jgi:hypothetical protein